MPKKSVLNQPKLLFFLSNQRLIRKKCVKRKKNASKKYTASSLEMIQEQEE